MKTKSSPDVCVVTTIHSDFDARIYDRGIRVLAAAGLRVAFVGPWPYDNGASGVAREDWHTTTRAAKRWLRPFTAPRTMWSARRVAARVYHFHDLDFVLFAVLLQAMTRSSVVYDVHENYPEDVLYHKDYIPIALRRPLSGVVEQIERFGARKFAAVVVVVASLEERFRKLAKRTVMVRNFSRHEPMPDLEHAPALLYSGGITRFYGAQTLLEIARELKRRGLPNRLVLVDKFTEHELRPVFIEAIEHESLPIDIIPLVPASELASVMRQGAIGLVPDDPSPIAHLGVHAKFFDYMAMGLPIVASDIANARALLTAAGCGVLVKPGDAGAFVDASIALINDPVRLGELRANGIRAFEQAYSWRHETGKLVQLMRDLLALSASPELTGPANP